jgi:2-polyprenyl-3-methyl-5-hydroxy-6-metoxy-1,4-benzoquinol methylase
MAVTRTKDYQKVAREEASSWDRAAAGELKKFPPDYRYYRQSLPYKIYRHKYVARMLSNIHAGNRVLELGCYNGWFSLEMVRKGAIVDAHDISSKAIGIAKKYFIKRQKVEKFTGKVNYFITDLNFPDFPANYYDVIVIRNVLHHLTNLKILVKKLSQSLKTNGKVLVDDALPCGKLAALITGTLLFILPTNIPYSQKLNRVFKKGQILKRTQGLVDACGASPFEGASGEESVNLINKYFNLTKFTTFTAFVGAIATHLKMINTFKLPVLKIIDLLDKSLIKIGVVRGTAYYLEATHALHVEDKK